MKKTLILLAGMSLILSSCGSKKKVVETKPTIQINSKETISTEETESVVDESSKTIVDDFSSRRVSTQMYINKYASIAKEEMEIYKIPASITLAQGILESSSGNSELTKKSNNHFGIKCHQKWTGARTYHDDDEKGECFRVYKEASSSFKDHSEFLNGRRRYSFLFELDKGDYISWAEGLRQAGYATDNQYPQKLIRIIEKYKLYQYDKEVLGEAYEKEAKNTLSHLVKKGETLYSIADFYGVSEAKLKQINHLTSSVVFVGQRITLRSESVADDTVLNKETGRNTQVVLGKTNKKTPRHHIVKQGETVFAISRKYKISVKKIKKYNNLSSNDIKVGQKLYLTKVDESLLSIEKKAPIAPDDKEINVVEEEEVVLEDLKIEESDITPVKQETIDVVVVEDVPVIKEEIEVDLPMKSIPKDETPPDFHTVKEGETLYAIAYKYNLEIPMFRKINGLKTDNVSVGQHLRLKKGVILPKTKEAKTLQKNHGNRNTHTVIKGDTLYSIATRNSLTVTKLKQLNNLKSNKILIGQVLVLD